MKNTHYDLYGGQYVAETLMPALEELDTAYRKFRDDLNFQEEMRYFLQDYVGR